MHLLNKAQTNVCKSSSNKSSTLLHNSLSNGSPTQGSTEHGGLFRYLVASLFLVSYRRVGSKMQATVHGLQRNLCLNALHILQNARMVAFWNTRKRGLGQWIHAPNIASNGPRAFLARGPFGSNNMKDKSFNASVAGFSEKIPPAPGQNSKMPSLSTSSLECEYHVQCLKNL